MGMEDAAPWMLIVPAVLSASLASSAETKDLPVDLWSHPKIPRLEAVEQQARDSPDSVGTWVDVDYAQVQTYSSWTGINVQNLNPTATTEFEITYEYLYLDCQTLYHGTPEQVLESMMASTDAFYPWIPTHDNSQPALDTLYNISSASLSNRGLMTFFLQFSFDANITSQTYESTADAWGSTMRHPMYFQYGAAWRGEAGAQGFRVFKCTPRVVTVNAHIRCESGDCSVIRLRSVPGLSSISSDAEVREHCNTTARLACFLSNTGAEVMFLGRFPVTVASYAYYLGPGEGGPYDQWIGGSNVTINTGGSMTTGNSSNQIPDALISGRLTILFNSYWQIVVWGPQVTRSGLFVRPEDPSGDSLSSDQWLNTTNATFARRVPVYEADIGWIVCLLLITTVLLLLGIISVVASLITTAPDLFHYASSLARENPYTNIPDGGTVLDGAERSRLLKRTRVQIADVSPDHDVGYIVLKSVEKREDLQEGRLRRDRMYW